VSSESAIHDIDLASTWMRVCAVWGPGIALLVMAGKLGWWGQTGASTAGLLWLASMCLWNAARCRRVHCLLTGPFFLVMAAVAVLVGFRVISFGDHTWSIVDGAILVVGVGLWIAPERLWGQYWR
jgi:hypothetical protein